MGRPVSVPGEARRLWVGPRVLCNSTKLGDGGMWSVPDREPQREHGGVKAARAFVKSCHFVKSKVAGRSNETPKTVSCRGTPEEDFIKGMQL